MSDKQISPEELEKSIQIGLAELKDTYKVPENREVIEHRAMIATNLGIFYWKKENLIEARKFFLLAFTEYEKIQDPFKIANINSTLGSLYIQLGEYASALKHSEDAYVYWKDQNYLNERIACMQNLGICYLKMKEEVKATEILLEALQMVIYLEDEMQFAATIQILLEHYEKIERFDMLLELKRKALQFWEKMELVEREIKTLIDLGVICQVLEEYSTALIYFKRAYNLVYNKGDIEKMYLTEGFIAETLIKLGEIEKAKYTYLQCFKLAVYLNSFSDYQEKIDAMRLMLLTLGYSIGELDHEERKAVAEAKKDKN